MANYICTYGQQNRNTRQQQKKPLGYLLSHGWSKCEGNAIQKGDCRDILRKG